MSTGIAKVQRYKDQPRYHGGKSHAFQTKWMHQNQAKPDIHNGGDGGKPGKNTMLVNRRKITAGKRIDKRKNGENYQKNNQVPGLLAKFRAQPNIDKRNPQ